MVAETPRAKSEKRASFDVGMLNFCVCTIVPVAMGVSLAHISPVYFADPMGAIVGRNLKAPRTARPTHPIICQPGGDAPMRRQHVTPLLRRAGCLAGNSVENPNHSETGLADVSKVRREPCEAGGRSAPSGL